MIESGKIGAPAAGGPPSLKDPLGAPSDKTSDKNGARTTGPPQAISAVVVGCGRVVELGHAPALVASESFRIAALVDPDADRRRAIRGQLAVRTPIAELDSVTGLPVANALVVITSPSEIRADLILPVLPSARAVVVEKPLAVRASLAAELLAHAQALGTHLVPVHNWLYDPAVVTLMALVQSGRLGAVTSLRFVHHLREPFRGAWQQAPYWRTRVPGGCLHDLGYHAVYLFEAILGLPLTAVSGVTRQVKDGVPYAGSLHLGSAASPAVCEVDVSWAAARDRFEVIVNGDRGHAELRDDGRLVVQQGAARDVLVHPAGMRAAYTGFYHDLAQRLQVPPDYGPARTAVRVSQLLEQALGSSGAMDPGDARCGR